jgi:hypothetical protein
MHTKRFDLQKRKPSIVVSFWPSVCSPEKDEMSLTECARVRAKRQKEWSHRESNTGRSRIFAGLIRSDGPQATVIPLHYRTDGRFDYPCNILYSILHALLLSRHRVLELNKSITVPSPLGTQSGHASLIRRNNIARVIWRQNTGHQPQDHSLCLLSQAQGARQHALIYDEAPFALIPKSRSNVTSRPPMLHALDAEHVGFLAL